MAEDEGPELKVGVGRVGGDMTGLGGGARWDDAVVVEVAVAEGPAA